MPRCLKGLLVITVLLLALFLFRIQLLLVHGQAKVWCALIDGQRLGLVTNLLGALDARGTGAELSYSLALEVHTVLRPDGSVVDVTSEVAETLDGWGISSRSETNAWNEPFASDLAAIRAVYKPVLLVLIEVRAVDVLVVCDVLADLPLLLDVLEVSSEFWAASVALLEGEVFPQVWMKD